MNPNLFNEWFGIGVIVVLTLIHSFTVGQSEKFQNIATIIKVVFVLPLISIGA